MDTIKRVKLNLNRDVIVQDLDVEEVISKLFSEGILTEDDVHLIESQSSRKDRARRLLDILPSKGTKAFDAFVASLDKYYPWLSEKLSKPIESQRSPEGERNFSDALLFGGLPASPVHNVTRVSRLSELRVNLVALKRGKYVVLHGMAGSGKSCLAAGAVTDLTLLVDSFKGCVYWLSVGDVDRDDVLPALVRLLHKLEPPTRRHRHTPNTVAEAQELLRKMFGQEAFREALVILDDVTSREVVAAFDVGCKTMITTKDRGCMNGVSSRMLCIELNDGFFKEESLALFSQCVDVPILELPLQATKIHYMCKGVPLVIALIGAQLAENRDDARRNVGRWNFYLDKLTNRDYGNINKLEASKLENGLLGAIGISIDSLPQELRNYYRYFALFVEDVNIKPEVLEILWSMNRYEVEDVMTEFHKKSLAVRKWNEQLNSYVYGIHDLLLYYLKQQLSDDEKKELHRTLLDRYRKVCDGKFANLPTNDNYIFCYLGHHLSQAEEWDTFKNLYFDLEFLGAKLKTSGLGDLLVDFRKYRDRITGGVASVEEMLDDYQQFVQDNGLDLFRYPDLDIIQCGLQQPRRSHVFKEAVRLAMAGERADKLYLELMLDNMADTRPTTLPLKREVCAACFSDRPNRILVANGNNLVHLWDVDYSRILQSFHGHREPVVCLSLRPDEDQFLSASEDGSVKLWSLRDVVCTDTADRVYDQYGCALQTPSPCMRQDAWSHMFGSNDLALDTSVHTLQHDAPVSCAAYSHDSQRIVTAANNITVWECSSGKKLLDWSTTEPATTCVFSWDNSIVLFSSSNDVLAHNANTGDFVFSLRNPGHVINILPIPDSQQLLGVTSSDCIHLWSLHTPRCLARSSPASYVCSAVTSDGRYLVAGDTEDRVAVWEVATGELHREYLDQSGGMRCLDTYMLEDDSHLLMSGADDGNVKVWRLDPSTGSVPANKLRPVFHAMWPTLGPEQLPVMAVLTHNSAKVVHGRKLLSESELEATACRVSRDGMTAAFGCRDGRVFLLQRGVGPMRQVMTLRGGGVHLLQFLPGHVDMLVAATPTRWKIWRDGEDCILSTELNKLVQCFKLASGQHVITCSLDGSVKVWRLDTLTVSHILMSHNTLAHISMAALSAAEDLLALTDVGSACLHLVTLDVSASPVALNSYQLGSAALRCCSFSADGRTLAVGHDTGDISLWDVLSRETYATLRLHLSWVRDLAFSAMQPSLLVSLGEVLGFWDLGAIQAQRRRRQSGVRRRSLNIQADAGPANIWCTKRGSLKKPELLGVVKLVGTHAERFDASTDFTVFTTVDSGGNVYHLKAFRGFQLQARNVAQHKLSSQNGELG